MNVCLTGTQLPVSEVEALNKEIHQVQVTHNLLVNAIEIEAASKVTYFIGEMEYTGIEFTVRNRAWTVYSMAVPVDEAFEGFNTLNKAALNDIAPEVRNYLWEYCRKELT